MNRFAYRTTGFAIKAIENLSKASINLHGTENIPDGSLIFVINHFTVNALDKDGWETDRGKIYVKYGQPTTVDRHTNELNVPPYEIWYYSSIDRRFIFEDRSSIGDYTLVKME